MCLMVVMSAGTASVVRAGGRTGPADGGRVDGAAAWVVGTAGVAAPVGWPGTAAATVPVSADEASAGGGHEQCEERIRRRCVVMER